MKLFSKYNRVNIIVTIIVLLLSAVLYYFFLEAALIHQLDKNLFIEENEINDFIKENKELPEPTNTKDEQEFYTLYHQTIARNISSIDVYNKKEKEYTTYRQLEFPVTANGKIYKADVRKSQEEAEDMVQLILKITLAVVLILLITLFIINRFVLNKLWKPFNATLQQIKQFDISGKKEVQLQKTNITEFTELNTAVHLMTKKANRDYNEIKNFTENASHEIQTPLAIIQSKIELLSQSENLKEEQMNMIQTISETTNRLSKLNQSLLLLTKIDNRQFEQNSVVNLSFFIQKNINNYEELIHAKEITLTKNIQPDVTITMNETLAETLIINLLTNAIKHNVENGSIHFELNKTSLFICNTGNIPNVDTAVYFERFKKDSDTAESLGLGLSIVKKICDIYNFNISYNFYKKLHCIKINF